MTLDVGQAAWLRNNIALLTQNLKLTQMLGFRPPVLYAVDQGWLTCRIVSVVQFDKRGIIVRHH